MLDQNRTIGVVEVANKCDGSDSAFLDQDQKVLEDLARLVGDSFYRHRWKALESFSSQGDAEAQALISQMMPSKSSTSPKAKARAEGEKASGAMEDFQWVDLQLPEAWTAGLQQMRSLNFSALDWSPEDLVGLVEPVMQHTGCIEHCAVPLTRLQNWAKAARKLYRDNSFHNWFHGFSVFQMTYFHLNSTCISGKLTSLDAFALLISSLCHDLDHPGFTNMFMIDSQSPLAFRHNDISVLENHHANLACELLRRDATAIDSGLDSAARKTLRRLVIKCILDTDMTHHNEMCQKLQAASGLEDKQLLMSACIHASDLSAQVLPWKAASQWEEMISNEFVNQAHQETAAGRTPLPFMNFKMEDIKQRGKLQRDFLDFVLVPLWDPWSQLVLDLRPCFRNLIKNRAYYNQRWTTGEDPYPERMKNRRISY